MEKGYEGFEGKRMNGIRLVDSKHRKNLHCALCGCQYAKYIVPATKERNFDLVVCNICFFKVAKEDKTDGIHKN